MSGMHGVNFTNVFCALFLYERPFFQLRFGFGAKIWYEKHSHKTLMKLTHGGPQKLKCRMFQNNCTFVRTALLQNNFCCKFVKIIQDLYYQDSWKFLQMRDKIALFLKIAITKKHSLVKIADLNAYKIMSYETKMLFNVINHAY